MAPASVQIVCIEPLIFLRGQSAVGEDARGRRRQIDFDAPPTQLRGFLTLNLPRPSRIKEISITLQGKSRTDWPEGIGPNRLDTVEESIIFKQKINLYDARDSGPSGSRPRASSLGPGISYSQEDFEWPPLQVESGPHTSTSHTRSVEASVDQVPSFTDLTDSSRSSGHRTMGKNAPSGKATASTEASQASAVRNKLGIKGLLVNRVIRKEDESSTSKNVRTNQTASSASGAESEAVQRLDWREFPKGTHSYPFSIPLPSNLPPTLHADFGSNWYTIKAHVHRVGPLSSNLSTEQEVVLVHAPDEDGQDEIESIVVERNWEDALRYMVVVMGKSFPVGGRIPIWAKFVPTEKVRIHRIVASLEERTAYYAKGRRIARHEVPRRWTLLKIAGPTKAVAGSVSNSGILPILSDDPDALLQSPLAPMARAAATSYSSHVNEVHQEEQAIASLADPSGPWELLMDLEVPTGTSTRISISSNHVKSNIAVHHLVKLAIRVERIDKSSAQGHAGDETAHDKRGNAQGEDQPKLYDILIEAPIAINHSQTANVWLTLPDYWSIPAIDAEEDRANPVTRPQPATDNLHHPPEAMIAAGAQLVGHPEQSESIAPSLTRRITPGLSPQRMLQAQESRMQSRSSGSDVDPGSRSASQAQQRLKSTFSTSSPKKAQLTQIGRHWLSLTCGPRLAGAISAPSTPMREAVQPAFTAGSGYDGNAEFDATVTPPRPGPEMIGSNSFSIRNITPFRRHSLDADLPTYDMIDGALGEVDPPPESRLPGRRVK